MMHKERLGFFLPDQQGSKSIATQVIWDQSILDLQFPGQMNPDQNIDGSNSTQTQFQDFRVPFSYVM